MIIFRTKQRVLPSPRKRTLACSSSLLFCLGRVKRYAVI